jgi:hypothetical protein
MKPKTPCLHMNRLYFGNDRVPFALVLGGQYVYIVSSAKDASSVFRNIEQLSFIEYVKDIMIRFGATPEGVLRTWGTTSLGGIDKIHASHDGKSIFHQCERIIQAQLHPGVQMEKIQHKFLDYVHGSAMFSRIPKSVILSARPTEKMVSLQGWVQHSLLASVTELFYGHQILKLDPRFLEAFSKFDETGWKLMYKIPAFLSKDMLQSKETMMRVFDRYFSLPLSERHDASWMIQELEERLRSGGSQQRDIIAYLLLLYWGYVNDLDIA